MSLRACRSVRRGLNKSGLQRATAILHERFERNSGALKKSPSIGAGEGPEALGLLIFEKITHPVIAGIMIEKRIRFPHWDKIVSPAFLLLLFFGK
jgi:hypothetical protein